MAFTAAETAVRGIVYRLGLVKQTCQITTGTDIWTRVDAAGNAAYENRVKGSDMTAVDTAFTAGNLGSNTAFRPVLELHNDWIIEDLSLTGWDAWLTASRWRVPEEFNDIFNEWTNQYLTVANVAPSDIISRGSFLRGGSFVDGTHVNSTYTGNSGLLTRVVVKTAGTWDLTIVMALDEAEATTLTPTLPGVAYTVRVAAGASVDTEYVLGEVDITGPTEAAGSTTIEMAETSPFVAGGTVLVYDDNAQEIATVDSVIADISVELTTGLKHTYTSAANAAMRGLYHHIVSVTDADGSALDSVTFWTEPDTTLAL